MAQLDCADRTNPGLAVDTPGSTPEVTSVGGTEFAEGSGRFWNATNNALTGASALSYIPETSWNDSAFDGSPSASGGGIERQFGARGQLLLYEAIVANGSGACLQMAPWTSRTFH